ncbi:hypothetical protein B0H10DRAFT_1961026 [Mycena sp. CBHHK59/15]|nr:hypothetical protein B0H10DRAFT_1961026 [Mycena sp. CBHHK59/15]
MDYHGALPSQSPQYGSSPGNSLHAANLTPSGQFEFQSHPLPAPPPPPNNTTNYTPQYFPASAAPRPLLPMATYTPGISASPFLQPVSRSEYSSQSVYGTPHHYTPAQTHQQDVEMSEDHTPTQMPGGYEPWSGGQRSGYQQMRGGIQNAYPYGAQPTPRPSTTNYQQMSGGIQNAYPYGAQPTPRPLTTNYQQTSGGIQNTYPYGAQPSPGPSTTPMQPYGAQPTPTQHNHNQISQSSGEQIMVTEHEYRHKVPSRASTRNGHNQMQPLLSLAPLQSRHQSSPSIPTHSGYQQPNRGVPYVAQPTPGPSKTTNRPLPSVDFRQSKIRLVEHPDSDNYRQMEERVRRERRSWREAETVMQGTNQQLNTVTEQYRRLQATSQQQLSETLLITLEMEADERVQQATEQAQQAERARNAEELEAKKRQAEYEASLTTLSRRFAVHRSPLPPRQQQEFPNAPPALEPRYISQTTRQTRQLETITRNVGGNLPHLRQVHGENNPADDHRDGRGSSSKGESEGEGVSRKGKGSRLQEILGSDKHALKGLIRELMKDMNVKKTQQSKMTKDNDLNCKTLAHEIFRLSTRLNRAEDFKNYKPATDAQAAQCGDPNGERPLPGVSSFYFGKGFKTSMWNDILLRGLEGRYTWARQKPRLGESEDMARVRARQFDQDSEKAKNSRARKDAKWKKRCAMAKKMTLLCAGEPEAVKVWQWVKRLLALLGTLGMSSEDAKPYKMRIGGQMVRQTTHIIQICPWHAGKVTETLASVDLAADQISLKKGTVARPRVRSDGISKTPAPPGLPETLYDEQWMEDGLEMDLDFKDDLSVSEEAFEIMELVAENLGIEVVEDMSE